MLEFSEKRIIVKTDVNLDNNKGELIAYFRPFSNRDQVKILEGYKVFDIIQGMFIKFNYEIQANNKDTGDVLNITTLEQLANLPSNEKVNIIIAACLESVTKHITDSRKEAVKIEKKSKSATKSLK